MVWFRYFRFLVSGSWPLNTRTSQVRGPRPTICPTFRAIVTPPPEWRHTHGTLFYGNLLTCQDLGTMNADRGSAFRGTRRVVPINAGRENYGPVRFELPYRGPGGFRRRRELALTDIVPTI